MGYECVPDREEEVTLLGSLPRTKPAAHPNGQKFFGSFFQKRTPSFSLPSALP
jgi:hypothetical protein